MREPLKVKGTFSLQHLSEDRANSFPEKTMLFPRRRSEESNSSSCGIPHTNLFSKAYSLLTSSWFCLIIEWKLVQWVSERESQCKEEGRKQVRADLFPVSWPMSPSVLLLPFCWQFTWLKLLEKQWHSRFTLLPIYEEEAKKSDSFKLQLTQWEKIYFGKILPIKWSPYSLGL